jgi:hypothetical protein
MTLTSVDVVMVSVDDDSPRAARKTLNPKRLHRVRFGTCCLASNPSVEGGLGEG